jgi:TM2 domain-containing membrane protein YozV
MENKKHIKSKMLAGILAWCLGMFGVHSFYLNRTTEGLIFLLLNVFLWWTIIVPIVIGLIVFVQGIYYFVMSDEEFDRIYN